ncbi:MAG TPA: hypothetical protein PLF13_10190 [candidate division Zixibacteria bacterium]|nr:hypothetical protein [candidate division Zixibacteria bacterium]
MNRVITLIIIAVLLLIIALACDNDILVNPSENAAELFPNEIGSIYHYEIIDSVEGFQDTIEVRIVGQKIMGNGDMARLWRREFNDFIDTVAVVVKVDTVKMYLGLYSDPTILILPAKVGNGWSVAPPGGDWYDTCSVVDSSQWAIRIGDFMLSYHIDRSWEGPGYTEHNTIYYAPEVGILYMDIEALTVIPDKDPVDVRWLLIDYTFPVN